MHIPVDVTSDFGPRPTGDGFHDGIDLRLPVGSILCAPFDGVVHHRWDSSIYGRYWNMDHPGGVVTRGAHLSAWLVGDGAKVLGGTPIARSGGAPGANGSGNSRGPHLHYEYQLNGKKLDPEIKGRVGELFHPMEVGDDMPLNESDKAYIRAVIAEAIRDLYLNLATEQDWGGPIDSSIRKPYSLKRLLDKLNTQ